MAYTIDQAKRAILNKWDWQNPSNNIPIFVWGPIGIGKTWIVQQAVIDRIISELKENLKTSIDPLSLSLSDKIDRLTNYSNPKEVEDLVDEHLLVLRLAERPIEQLQGIPAPDFQEKKAVFLMPENIVRLKNARWCVVFVDELDKADESKMTAATHLIESGRIGDFILPKDTFIIAAANRVTDSWISRPVVPELRNRGAHIEVEPDLNNWFKWAEKNNIRKDIIQFLKFKQKANENYLARYPLGSEADTFYAFPTPRTWHKGSNQMDKLEKKGISYEEILRELKQFVGEAAGIEFNAYYELYSKINIEAILNGTQKIPKITNNNFKAISEQYVYAFAICDQITPGDLQNEQPVKNLCGAITDFCSEIRVVFLQMLATSNQNILSILCASQYGKPFVNEIIEYISKV